MPTTITQGFQAGGKINATGTKTWTNLGNSPYGSWTNWTKWNPVPNDIIVEIEEDTGAVSQKTPLLACVAQGDMAITLVIGDTRHATTGAIIAHTTITFATNTDYDYTSGRYYKATITISGNANYAVPELQFGPKFNFTNEQIVENRFNVNTATLGGTIDARPVTTDIIGTVTGVIITAQEEGVTYSSGLLQDRVYAIPDNYTFQENAIVSNVVSKSPLKIRCFDLNGESIDAVVDLQIYGLSEIRQGPEGIIAA
jgi:hypothetical protein